jgi:heavy metal sensor kinase
VNVKSIHFRMTAWYAGLLVCLLMLFGASVYFGLRSYLERHMRAALSEQARAVGEEIGERVTEKRLPTIVNYLNEKFAPQLNSRFIRISDAAGGVMYLSARTPDHVLDPALVPAPARPSAVEYGSIEILPNGRHVLVQVLPVSTTDGAFTVAVGSLYAPIDAILSGLMTTFAIWLPASVAVAIGGGFLLTRRAMRQIDAITVQAEHISSNNLSERLPVFQTGDELERLTVALNRMMERLDDAFQHINRFSADVSHELRTPLTILRGELEAAVQQDRLSPELQDLVGSALEETERLRTIVDQLLIVSRLDAGDVQMEKVSLDLGQLATSTAEQMVLLAEEKSITVRCQAQPGVDVEGDPSRLKQVVVNLLDNAIRYTGEGGTIVVSTAKHNGWATLTVSDNGVGIPPEALPHVLERFYRADKARSRYSGGSGLGLSIVNAICAAHRGEVEIASTEGVGTTVTIRLLASSSPKAAGRRAESTAAHLVPDWRIE